jgi:chromosome segregation ATPase
VTNDSEPVWNRILHELLDFRREVDERLAAADQRLEGFRNETLLNFDAVFKRLEKLEIEYHLLTAAVKQLELKWSEDRLTREDARRELIEIKAGIADLQERVTQLESKFHDA